MTCFIHTQKQKHLINNSGIDHVFESIYTTVKSSGWIIDSVIENNIGR